MRRLPMLAVVLLALAGCSPSEPATAPTPSPHSAAAAVDTERAEALGDYDAKRDPRADIKAALARAATDKHNVLIDFGADWCVDCQVLTKLSRSAPVATVLRDGYHVVSVDIGEFDRNLDVAKAYRVDLQNSGIPALVVLSPAGQVRVATNDGSFANARQMKAAEVARFLSRWSPPAR